MIKPFIFTIALLLPLGEVARSEVATYEVFYFDFSIDPFVPTSESDIEKRGCLYYINSKDFHSSLREYKPKSIYDSRNVKVKIIGNRGRVYFVDADGNVKSENARYYVEPRQFSSLLKPKGSYCR